MFETFANLLSGFEAAITPMNLLWVGIGCLAGTLIGILPGLSPSGALAILLPFTFGMDATAGLIMMAGMYYGAKYGGSTTSILLNVPGESASVVTCLDGYALAKQGRAGAALGISAISSFIAGTFGVIMLALTAPLLADFALRFGPPEYFALMLLGLSAIVFLTDESALKGAISGIFGLLLATVGVDIFTNTERLTFGELSLLDGVDFIIVTIGVFGVAEIFSNFGRPQGQQIFKTPKRLREIWPTKQDFKESRVAFANGSIIGFIVGLVPGAGSSASSFIAYGIQRAISPRREKLTHGAIEGVAAPEGANNAETGGAMVPLLCLGIPASGTMAVMLAALLVWGLQPGPLLFTDRPDIVWPLIASMFIGNVALLIMNLPLVPVFASILRFPYHVLYPAILGISTIGVYALNQNMFDVWLLFGFGILGYLMRKVGIPGAPMVLGLVLGGLMEAAFRQSLILSNGSFGIFFESTICRVVLGVTLLLLFVPAIRSLLTRRRSSGSNAAPSELSSQTQEV